MTTVRPPFDEAEFHRRQRQRLGSARHMPAFKGPWADVLSAQLQSRLSTYLRLPVDELAVVDCFAQTPTEQLELLLHCVSKACEAVGNLDQPATIWATELTVYAALRVLDADTWAALPNWQSPGSSTRASTMRVPVKSSLVASLGLALLSGRFIRLSAAGRARGIIDLSALSLGTDPFQGLMAALYDHLFQAGARRPNPNLPLDAAEVGQLHAAFADFRLGGEVAAPYILLLGLDAAMQRDVEQKLANALNVDVLHGDHAFDAGLVRAISQFTVYSLAATVDKIFRLLPNFAPPPPASTGTATSTAAASQNHASAAAPAPAPAYTYDLFISHASEDKAAFVDPLVAGLKAVGLRVWYHKFELTLGDSLRGRIDAGLRNSRFGVVVLSPRFFAKGWPAGELDALLSHELTNGGKRVLPVWLDLSASDVQLHSPLLASRLAIDASQGLPAVVAAVLTTVQRAP